jgi:hypothetical protein
MADTRRVIYTAHAHVTGGRTARRRRREVADVAIDSSVMLMPTASRGYALALTRAVTLTSIDDQLRAWSS